MAAFDIKIETTKGYIVNIVHEDLTADILKDMMQEDQKLSDHTGIKSILSDVRKVQNMINYIEDYSLLKASKAVGLLNSNTKIAILASKEDRSFFAHETFALNVGYNIKLFKDLEAAEQWLAS